MAATAASNTSEHHIHALTSHQRRRSSRWLCASVCVCSFATTICTGCKREVKINLETCTSIGDTCQRLQVVKFIASLSFKWDTGYTGRVHEFWSACCCCSSSCCCYRRRRRRRWLPCAVQIWVRHWSAMISYSMEWQSVCTSSVRSVGRSFAHKIDISKHRTTCDRISRLYNFAPTKYQINCFSSYLIYVNYSVWGGAGAGMGQNMDERRSLTMNGIWIFVYICVFCVLETRWTYQLFTCSIVNPVSWANCFFWSSDGYGCCFGEI